MFSFGQNFPFVQDFKNATITFQDGTKKNGFVKWNTNQNERLRFKEAKNSEVVRYSAVEIINLSVDSLIYEPLFDVEVYAENYPLLGKTSTLKQSFGQLLHSGTINIYFVVYHGYEPMTGSGVFQNIVFEKVSGDKKEYAAYPIGIRMKDKRYEAAKEKLYLFFANYPTIVDKIKAFEKQQDFFDITNFVKTFH
jgi:hypothetical protein